MSVQIFHMMNIDVPASVGAPPLDTQLPNCLSNTPYTDSLGCPQVPTQSILYWKQQKGGWGLAALNKNLGLNYKVGMQCFIYMDSQLGCMPHAQHIQTHTSL